MSRALQFILRNQKNTLRQAQSDLGVIRQAIVQERLRQRHLERERSQIVEQQMHRNGVRFGLERLRSLIEIAYQSSCTRLDQLQEQEVQASESVKLAKQEESQTKNLIERLDNRTRKEESRKEQLVIDEAAQSSWLRETFSKGRQS